MRFFLVFALNLLCGLSWAWADPVCQRQTFETHEYSVCTADLRTTKIELFNLDGNGEPYGSLSALADAQRAQGHDLLFAMNAGMFGEDLKPIGLYVEDGVQARKLNLRDGSGNFHLKPNGVFFIQGNRLGVMSSERYAKAGLKPDFASQSGPMLVIDGAIHPKFSASGTSAKIRNGVGEIDEHKAVFVLSDDPVTFHEFARFFRDGLHSNNALFFDGSVSSLYSTDLGEGLNLVPLGPMVAAYHRQLPKRP